MNHDLKESLMIVSNRNSAEYEIVKNYSIEDFLIKYEVFVGDIQNQQKANKPVKKTKNK